MGINKISCTKCIISSAGLCLLMILTGCPDAPESFDYQFKLPFEISPQNDTLNVGDTLWIKSDFSDEFLDKKSNSLIKFSSEKLYSLITPNRIQKAINQPNSSYNWALADFNLYSMKGTIESDEISFFLIPEYKNNRYSATLGVIPLKQGLYFFDSGGTTVSGIVNNKSKKALTVHNYQVINVKKYLVGDDFKILLDEYINPKLDECGNCLYFFYVRKK